MIDDKKIEETARLKCVDALKMERRREECVERINLEEEMVDYD